MLKHRVIPLVLLDGYSVIKTIEFKERRNLGNPITVAKVYNTRNVDELILLDIDAAKQNRSIDLFTIQEIASECFMPLTVGGGLRSIEDIQKVLEKGADKVTLNIGAMENPELVREAASVFGAQCIVVSVDVYKQGDEYKVYSHVTNGTTEINVSDWCKQLEDNGAGEILLNIVNNDGKMKGYDYKIIKIISSIINIPVIVCGGASSPNDCVKAIEYGASAVCAASIFHFTSITPNDCKLAMIENGISVRDPKLFS